MNEPQCILKTSGLSLAFGRVQAVNGLDMTVRAGEIYGFLGRNGAGKTSTIRMIMGIVRCDRGAIELFGERVRRTRLRQKRLIGYVSQEQHYYPWMTCESLGRFVAGFYPTWDKNEFARLLRVLDLPGKRRVSHLSGGMRVKLALALALAHRPPILILDEPTAGLDPVTRREFLDMISQQARNHQRTTFFSSHLIDEVERVADRVGIIHKGHLRYEGDVTELRQAVRQVLLPVPEQPMGIAALPGSEDSAAALIPAPAVKPEAGEQPVLLQPAGAGGAATQQARTLGFEVLRSEISDGVQALTLMGSPQAWQNAPYPATAVRQLSLEDIFIAIASDVTEGL